MNKEKNEEAAMLALLNGVKGKEYEPIFSQLVHGELTREQEEELKNHVDPEMRRIYDLFKPFDEGFKEKILNIIQKK